jgi:hypothetical protein
VIVDLQALVKKLRGIFLYSDIPGPLTEEDYEDHCSFEEICHDAACIAEELLNRLNNLKED